MQAYRRQLRPITLGAALFGLALAYQGFFFVVPNAPFYREGHTRYGADVAFARDFLAKKRVPGAPLPTVYCDWGRIDYVWVDLHTKSYFDGAQIVGVLFNPRTAAEGRRRAAAGQPLRDGALPRGRGIH